MVRTYATLVLLSARFIPADGKPCSGIVCHLQNNVSMWDLLELATRHEDQLTDRLAGFSSVRNGKVRSFGAAVAFGFDCSVNIDKSLVVIESNS